MKLKHDRKWVIYKIEGSSIVKEREGDKDATYDSFVAALKEVAENEPRYAVVDYHYNTEDGRPQDKLLFIGWSPDTCGVKPKMTYASTKDALQKKLNGIHKAEVCLNNLNIYQTYLHFRWIQLLWNTILSDVMVCVILFGSRHPKMSLLFEALQITDPSDLDPKEIESQLK